MTLSETLHQKIDHLIQAHAHLKSENQMLRDELQVSKRRLQEQADMIQNSEGSADIQECVFAAIIEKLETALGTH